MKPLGEVAKALLKTACELSAAGRRVTLAEMRAGSGVGKKAARTTVASLKKRGHLKIVGERAVCYRNRPVKEYLPVTPDAVADAVADAVDDGLVGFAELSLFMSAWAR